MASDSPQPITIVSGLPRSGTSLAMQMLAAGGIEPLTDGERAADESNPRGYLELQAVMRTKDDPSWVAAARGRAVKVVSHLVAHLPRGETYRIVFVERDLDEVLASQEAMLQRLGRPAAPRDAVRRAFTAHLRAFEQLVVERSEFQVLRIRYAEIVAAPLEASAQIDRFLAPERSAPLDRTAMAAAVDPSLYRNRSQ